MAYRNALFLADALRRGGLTVVEYQGWKKRGRPTTSGPFDPRALIFHHDASAGGPSPAMARYIAEAGKPPSAPAPLSQLWVDTSGKWHVLASGRANHAGRGSGWGRIPKDCGNTYAIGVETDHTSGEQWPAVQYQAIIKGFAALADAMSIDVNRSLCAHKEYAPGRKADPDGVDMNRFRRAVADEVTKLRRARNAPTPKPPPPRAEEVDLSDIAAAAKAAKKAVGVDIVQRALDAEFATATTSEAGTFGKNTKAAYAKWQKALGYKGKDADGIPGMTSLTKLGRKHGFKVKR